jgi:hypothetical protein
MVDSDFLLKLKDAMDERKNYLDKTDLPKLRDDFRVFQKEISSLYALFANKGHIIEDPYKNETKTGVLEIPPSGGFSEGNKRDQLGMRLSMLDNELDFLINFHEFSTASFTQDKIKTVTGLVRYIDWPQLGSPASNVTTVAVNEIVTNIRHGPNDPITYKMLTDSITALSETTTSIIKSLKMLSDFNRESYKYDIRFKITKDMSPSETTLSNIRKMFSIINPGQQFYAELAGEIINEDYSKDSKSLQEKLLQRLTLNDTKLKTKKHPASYKPVLIDGLNTIGSCGAIMTEIFEKLGENYYLLENQKKGLWLMIKKLVAQITNKDAEAVVFDLEYTDPVKGITVREKLNYNNFYAMAEKKIAILGAIATRGSAVKKLEAMEEHQLIELLQRNIKDVQNFHKTLNVLDEYFKTVIDKSNRSKIRGIKPELSALKNTIMKASEKLQDYNSHKEEEDQFKKLGVSAEY